MLGNLSQTSLLVASSTRLVLPIHFITGAVVRHSLLLFNQGLARCRAQGLQTVSVLERLHKRPICPH